MASVSNFRRVDIHAHLNFPEFESDLDTVVHRALDGGTAVINVGTDLETSKQALRLAEGYPEGMYAIVGLHPTDVAEIFEPTRYLELLQHPKTVGVGECGLDYFRLPEGIDLEKSKSRQRELFSAQIALANESGKSLMLHIRTGESGPNAYDDALNILRAEAKVKGDSHFFAGTIEQARGFLDIGYTLSFTGVITFASQYEELVKYVPLDMIQAETDCPFVAPLPYRGRRNEPSYVSEVVRRIAEIKKLPLEDVEHVLLDNARRVWGLSI